MKEKRGVNLNNRQLLAPREKVMLLVDNMEKFLNIFLN